jgi:hypothetical protein
MNNLINILKKFINPKIDISDEYVEWLCFANAGMLNRGNLYSFDYAIKNLPSNNPILEIGSFCGLSTNLINYYLFKNNKNNLLFTADKWIFEGSESESGRLGDSLITHQEYREFVKSTFKRNVSFFSKNNLPHTIECFSDELFELWSQNKSVYDVFDREVIVGGPISFCYIDGDHSYDFAKRDFENSDKYLEKGGFVLFDDSSDRQNLGSSHLMKEILKNEKYELIIKNPNYLFRKK